MRKIDLAESPGDRSQTGVLPAALRGRWCLLTVRTARTGQGVPRIALVQDTPGGQQIDAFPRRVGWSGQFWTLVFVPAQAGKVRFEILGTTEAPPETTLHLLAVSRYVAAALLAISHPLAVLRAGTGGRLGLYRRLRAMLAMTAAAGGAPRSYQLWVALFDTWSSDDLQMLLASSRRPAWPLIAAMVLTTDETSAATRATLASLRGQAVPVQARLVTPGSGGSAMDDDGVAYVAILQAGEVLPSHAVALLSEWAARLDRPAVLFADDDQLSRRGVRRRPHFKPQPNRALMLSGTLSRGVWLVRRDVLATYGGEPGAAAAVPWAEALRLHLWLRLYERDRACGTRRIPFVLTHHRPDAETAPPSVLARVVAQHLDRLSQTAEIDAICYPLRVRPVLPASAPSHVRIIVPSACRAPHVRRCVGRMLSNTTHRDFDLCIVVSQGTPLDATQCETLRVLTADARARVMRLKVAAFNYAQANNFAARDTDAAYICLLNDDVLPMDPHWLTRMVGHFADPAVGVVGAKLYYPNATIQHGGVLMGSGGLPEHINRFLPRRAPGYAGRAILSQQVSAVTGACMLVRREVFESVGGLDETFPIAFNDVDFCLRVASAGWSVVFCADAELFHYESLSLGHHFAGERAATEQVEAGRMRARWGHVVKADPYHNPNLSLRKGHEWTLAFPPRIERPTDRKTPPLSRPDLTRPPVAAQVQRSVVPCPERWPGQARP